MCITVDGDILLNRKIYKISQFSFTTLKFQECPFKVTIYCVVDFKISNLQNSDFGFRKNWSIHRMPLTIYLFSLFKSNVNGNAWPYNKKVSEYVLHYMHLFFCGKILYSSVCRIPRPRTCAHITVANSVTYKYSYHYFSNY